jgi:glycosyltransferase involved in cell wall biosynthesis
MKNTQSLASKKQKISTVDETSVAISVVIPVYRSNEVLPKLHERLTLVLGSLNKSYEIVFVEDCGGDNAWHVISQIANRDPNVVGVQLSRNSGQHNALLAGIRMARGTLIITLDDDLQNPPEEIPKLLAALTDDVDVVYGTPAEGQHGFLRNIASKITKFTLQEAMGATNARHVSTYRLFRSDLRQAFDHYRGSFANIDVFLTWGTNRFSATQVAHDPRTIGASGYTFRKLIAHAFNMLTGFTIIPLQIASLLGFVFSILGMMVLIYVFIIYFFTDTAVAGFTFLASMIAILSGVQLFSIGMLGEYLARVHLGMMEKPPYTVRKSVGTRLKEYQGEFQ